jgi:hypothetical protein
MLLAREGSLMGGIYAYISNNAKYLRALNGYNINERHTHIHPPLKESPVQKPKENYLLVERAKFMLNSIVNSGWSRRPVFLIVTLLTSSLINALPKVCQKVTKPLWKFGASERTQDGLV